ncbi:aminoglycoside phosphotransferase [Salinactinospora qingdaonensis]
MRTQIPEDVLDLVQRWLGLRLERDTAAYGNTGTTAGFRSDAGTWVRLQRRSVFSMNGQSWTGAECASVLQGVAKPELLRSVRWRDDDREAVWRADEMTLVDSAVISPNGSVTADPQLPDAWWSGLATSLAALSRHETERVGMRQEHVTRRIREVFGDGIETTIDEWRTAHADLHWGNLTAPTCHLLDWEDWGSGPRGLDAATLWGFSLGVPSLADRIQHEFSDELQSRSGTIAMLLFCANALRAATRTGRSMPFTEPARTAASGLMTQLDQ